MSQALASLVTALADDELVLGHRHSEWTGYAPHMEEDVAFSSIAQDEIGHAAAYYSLAARLDGGDPDALALGRPPDRYRSAIICERPNKEWAYTLARHWLYDHADAIRLEALEASSSEELAQLVRKIRREERYHVMHADAWMKRLVRGRVEGRAKLVDAMRDVHAEAAGLFEPFEHEQEALETKVLPVASEELHRRFTERTADALDELGLPTETYEVADERAEFVASSSGDLIERDGTAPATGRRAAYLGGRAGRHTPDFDELWDVMTATYRANPGATW